jgi:hypothetical protein
LDAYQGGTDQTFRRADVTAREFGIRYLGMVNPAVIGSPTPVGGGRVEVGLGFLTGENGIPIADPKPTTSVFLISGGADGDQGAWTVVGASSPQIVVTQPAALDRISSPVAVRGQAATFEGNVLVEVRQDGMLTGANLGFAPVTGRGDGVLGGFSGDITFSSPTKTGGAVVFSEHSALDNSGVVRASVVKVAF